MIGEQLFRRAGTGDVQRRHVEVGTVLVREGNAPGGIHRLVEARAVVEVHDDGRPVRVATLGPGALVGEIALLAGSLSTATVTVVEAGVVESLDLASAEVLLDGDPELRGELAEAARHLVQRGAVAQLLDGLLPVDAPDLVAVLADELPVHRLRAGDELGTGRDSSTGAAHAVVTGRLAVHRNEDGDDVEVARLGRGQVVGEAALSAQDGGPHRVSAVRDTVVVEIRDDVVTDVLGAHPPVLARVVRRLAELDNRPPRTVRGVASTLAVVTIASGANPRVLSTWVAEALSPFGSVGVVTAARVDADLRRPFIADVGADDAAAPRLRAYLHERELADDRLVLEAARDRPTWTRTVCGVADRVLVVASAAPDDDEEEVLRRVLADVPDSTTTLLVMLHDQGTERPHGTAARRAELGVDSVLHAIVGDRAGIERTARIAGGCAVGLVLGGGGARGFAHIGVQQALAEHEVPVDVVIGASIGAPLAGGMALGLDAAAMRPVVRTLFADLLDYTVPVVSLVKGERITAAIEAQFAGWDFEDTWLPFRCVSTNLTTSRSVVHSTGPIGPAVRASVAIPGVLPPVPWGEDLLVDGGVLDNLPVDIAAAEGVGTLIAVDVAPHVGPRAHGDFGLSVSGWQALRKSLGRGRSEYPGITAVLMRSMIVGSQASRGQALAAADVDLLLEVSIRGVSLLAFDDVDEVADAGYEASEPQIAAWLADRGGWAARPG